MIQVAVMCEVCAIVTCVYLPTYCSWKDIASYQVSGNMWSVCDAFTYLL